MQLHPRDHHAARHRAARSPTQKKSLIATERDEAARTVWRATITILPVADLVFLDETSTQTTMTRNRGRAPCGQRLHAANPRNHGPTVTCIAALTVAGIRPSLAFVGALDGPLFAQWVDDHLVPVVRSGQLVILDNLSVHKNADARRAIEAAGCQLRVLPAYSPDVNPIEVAFSNLKAHLRGAGVRTVETLITEMRSELNAMTSTYALAFFRHAGYR